MTSDSRSPVLAWLGLGLLLAASAAATLAIAKLGSLLFAWLGSPTVWQVLGGLVVAWGLTFRLPSKVRAPLRAVLQWWIVGTACAALALVVASHTDAGPEALRHWEEGWLGVKEKLGVVFAYDLLPALLASGWFLSLSYAPRLSDWFRRGHRALGAISSLLTVLTAFTSFSFFTVLGDYDDRLDDVTMVVREKEGKVAANLARDRLSNAVTADPQALAKTLRKILEGRLSCANGQARCRIAIHELKAQVDAAPAADSGPVELPEAFARPPRTVSELQKQRAARQTVGQELDTARKHEAASRQAAQAGVDILAGALGETLLSSAGGTGLGDAVRDLAQSLFELCVNAIVGEKIAATLAESWPRLADSAGRLIDRGKASLADRSSGLSRRIRDIIDRDSGKDPARER